jgi:hypothetical protein
MVGGQETLADLLIQSDLWFWSKHDGQKEELCDNNIKSYVWPLLDSSSSRTIEDFWNLRICMVKRCVNPSLHLLTNK